ncbi:hypothetical protein OKW29_002659 [Paraburkholderia sp. CI3]
MTPGDARTSRHFREAAHPCVSCLGIDRQLMLCHEHHMEFMARH